MPTPRTIISSIDTTTETSDNDQQQPQQLAAGQNNNNNNDHDDFLDMFDELNALRQAEEARDMGEAMQNPQ